MRPRHAGLRIAHRRRSTDSKTPAVQISYRASGVGILFLVFFRILATRAAGGKPRAARPEPRPAMPAEAPGTGA